jgi:uncharacterized protein YjbJ (UPF0337 family)
MKTSTRDKAEGTFHQIKGVVKEVTGKLIDNPKLQAEGVVEKVSGKVQEQVGKCKSIIGK